MHSQLNNTEINKIKTPQKLNLRYCYQNHMFFFTLGGNCCVNPHSILLRVEICCWYYSWKLRLFLLKCIKQYFKSNYLIRLNYLILI